MTLSFADATLSRRTALAAMLAASFPTAGWTQGRGTGAAPVSLPDAEEIRRAYQRMVDFGPRLPGNANHLRFVEWMANAFREAGLQSGTCTEYDYRRWEPHTYGLKVGTGEQMRALSDIAYYVRSHPTGPEGVTGPLIYGGEMTPDGPTDLGDIPPGAIVVFDARLPDVQLGHLLGEVDYIHGVASAKDYLDEPYKRLWLTPAFPLEAVRDKGGAGVIIIMDVPSAMIRDNFSPHSSPYQPPLPGLFVGREAGAELKSAIQQKASAQLTLHAEWIDGTIPSIVAVLQGETDEIMVLNTHTDGQNFIEENGCVALVQLARYFATRPAGERLRRTLVFAAWPGHMAGTMPQCEGWIRSHQDIVGKTAAAFTIEHLGAPEWVETAEGGYAATGRNEYMNCPATAGPLRDLVISGIRKHDLGQHGAQQAPGITVGSAFHETGVPHAGFICGPNYLLGVVPNGHIDKLDADLASRQMAMLAELISAVDKIDAATLRRADHSLGEKPVTGADTSRATCSKS